VKGEEGRMQVERKKIERERGIKEESEVCGGGL